MPRVERWSKKGFFLRFEATDDMNGWRKDCSYPFIVKIYLPSPIVCNKDELYWPFGRFELHGRLVRFIFSGYEAHVPTWDADKGGHVGVASDCGRGPRRVVPYLKDHDG